MSENTTNVSKLGSCFRTDSNLSLCFLFLMWETVWLILLVVFQRGVISKKTAK